MPRQPTAAELALIDPGGTFRDRLARDLQTLVALRREHDAADELETVIHRLAGAAETFGYVAVGQIAITLDDAFVRARETGSPVPAVEPLIDALRAATTA
jgi:HPt (histidine-containing phosphotransfer) domain-containing protein